MTEPTKPEAVARTLDPLASGSANLFWAKIAGNGGYFVAVLIVARGLGPAGRGTVAFITVTALVVAHVAGLGVGEATTVLAAREPRRRPLLLANALVFYLASSLVAATLTFTGLLASDVGPAGVGATELVILASGIVACAVGEVGLLLPARDGAHARAGVRHRMRLVALRGGRVRSLGRAWAHRRAARRSPGPPRRRCAPSSWSLSRGEVRSIGNPSRRILVEEIGFGIRLWIGSLARFLNFRTDQILMGFLASEAALGFYAVAVNASEILLYLPSSAATALLPLIARTEAVRRGEETLRAFRSVAFVSAIGAVAAAILGPLVLPAVFGDAFDESIIPFLWLLPGTLGFAASTVFSNALVGSSSPGLSSLGPIVSLTIGFALDLALIPQYDATGAAVAASAAFLAGGAVALATYHRVTPFSWRALLVPHRGDLDVLRALARPLLRVRARRGTA